MLPGSEAGSAPRSLKLWPLLLCGKSQHFSHAAASQSAVSVPGGGYEGDTRATGSQEISPGPLPPHGSATPPGVNDARMRGQLVGGKGRISQAAYPRSLGIPGHAPVGLEVVELDVAVGGVEAALARAEVGGRVTANGRGALPGDDALDLGLLAEPVGRKVSLPPSFWSCPIRSARREFLLRRYPCSALGADARYAACKVISTLCARTAPSAPPATHRATSEGKGRVRTENNEQRPKWCPYLIKTRTVSGGAPFVRKPSVRTLACQ